MSVTPLKNGKILAVVGPTASGKTALAVELAKRLDGEIISCDSMQVYKGMDIGTAKVTEAEMSRQMLEYLLGEARKIKECHGVFYWEPQSPDGYNGGYDMGAFENGRPTVALDPFKQ